MANAQKQEIKTEYLNGKSIRKLSAEFGVPRSTIELWVRKEGWTAQREVKTYKAAVRIQPDKAVKATKASLNALIGAEQEVANLLLKCIQEKAEQGGLNASEVRSYFASLESYQKVMHIKSAEDLKEQEARIRNLEKQLEVDQVQSVEVVLSNDVKDYSN